MSVSNLWARASSYLNNGHRRSVLAKKNIIKLTLIRIIGVGLSFLVVPLTIGYVDAADYGIWVALSSVVAWVSLLDLGLSNGLRNRLTQAMSHHDRDLSQRLVSTAYAALTMIFIPVFLLLLIAAYFVNWGDFLNLPANSRGDLWEVVGIVALYFCLRFIFSTVNIVLLATQNAAQAAYSGVLEQALLVVVVYLLTKTTHGSLKLLAIAVCFSSLAVLLTCNLAIFGGKLRDISPRLSKIDFSLAPGIFSLGLKFFVIQIAGIVQFQTANLILIRSYGPVDVTNYNIAVKYFSLLPMVMSILLTPLWSAVTEAKSARDIKWIGGAVRKYEYAALILIFVGLAMLLISPVVYGRWISNPQISVPFGLSAAVFILNALNAYGAPYCCALNGLGELDLQFKACLISPLIFLASCYLLMALFDLGSISIVLASIVANFNGYLLAPWQFKKLSSSSGS